MNNHNCPNCGAPIESDKCPYCGTVFYDFASISNDHPTYIKIRYMGNNLLARVIMTHAELIENEYGSPEIAINFVVLPNDDGIVLTTVKEEKRE